MAMAFNQEEGEEFYQGAFNQEEGEDMYQGLSSDSSMHPSPSGVDEMEYEEVISLMKYLNMKSTESGERDRLLLKNYLYAERWIGSYEDKVNRLSCHVLGRQSDMSSGVKSIMTSDNIRQFPTATRPLVKLEAPKFVIRFKEQPNTLHIQDTVNKIMKKCVAEKNRLRESYLDIQKMAGTDAFKTELSPILEERFPKYMEQLQERITKLTTDDIEICIIGWTCAGKSTFFNVLLGEEIMPTNVLPDTPCLVRLHNSQTRKIQYDAAGEKRTVGLTEDPQNAKCQLKAILDEKHGSDQALDVLDLYWPIPRFHENIIFVDTPGIGEKNSLTELVMKHVPNAAGYICIINSGDGGGILEGGIVQLFKAIADREGQTENKLGNVLFICNKWDMIKRQDRQAVSEDTQKKLRLYFGGIEDWQIIHFSGSVELQLSQLRASPTDDFLKILEGLDRLVSRTVKKLFFDFFGWIKNVIGKSVDIIDTKMSLLTLSNAELIELANKTATVLEETKINIESKSKKLETMVDTKKSEIIKDLQTYLKSSRVQKRAGDWKHTNLKGKPSEIVMERIHMLISEWAVKDEGVLKKAIADVEKEFVHFATDIEKCLSDIRKMETDCCHERTVEGDIKLLRNFDLFTVPTMIALMFTSVVFGPLAIVISLYIAKLICIFQSKTSQLTKLTLETLEKVSNDEYSGNLISTLFELPLKNSIEQFRSTIQCEIASQEKLVQELNADVYLATDLQSTFVSLFHELNKYLMHLEKISVEYYSDENVSYECLSIDSSPVSATEMFHLHDVTNLIEGKRFSLQVINPRYSAFQLNAFSKLRKMKHTNFMRPEGVVYSTSIPEDMKACGCSIYSLRLLIQRSIGDLEQYVFTNRRVQGRYSGEYTEDFFQTMTLGIANGLLYVHEMGFVHGHLQLSSILLAEDMTPKLCHIDVLPSLQERNHSICIFHTAPEVISGEKYGPKADIYSLGILLWELWYGRHTPPGINLTEKSVIHGIRPKFEEKYPKNDWIGLMQLCWTDSPDRRPSAAACVRTSSNVV